MNTNNLWISLGLKLKKDFYNAHKDKFNISKVPDIYDSIKYDLLHNKNILQFPHAEDLYVCSKALADIVVPQVNPKMIFSCKEIHLLGIWSDNGRKIKYCKRDCHTLTSKNSCRYLSICWEYFWKVFLVDLQCNLTGVWHHDEHVNKLDPR